MKLHSLLLLIAFYLGNNCYAHDLPAPPISSKGANIDKREAVFSPMHAVTGESERVFGDPNLAGKPFVVRIRELPGTIIAPHTHTWDENITVVQGILYFGIGADFDKIKLQKLPTGSFIFIPTGTPMFGYAPDGVVLQIHGIGPFTQKFTHKLFTLEADPDPDLDATASPSSFRFHKGERVVIAHRGQGTIQQGFRTGSVTEYIVATASGDLLMAQEAELAKR